MVCLPFHSHGRVCLTSASPLAGLFAGEECVQEQLLCFPGVDGPLEIPGSSPGKLGRGDDSDCYCCSLDIKRPLGRTQSNFTPYLQIIITHHRLEHLVIYLKLFIQGRPLRAGSLFQWCPDYNIQIKTEIQVIDVNTMGQLRKLFNTSNPLFKATFVILWNFSKVMVSVSQKGKLIVSI